MKATWDCQSVELRLTEVDAKVDNTATVQFSNEKDWKYTGKAADFTFTSAIKDGGMVRDEVNDDNGEPTTSVSKKATHNWQISNSKTATNCTKTSSAATCARPLIDATDAEWMDSGITYHWFRNFKTQDLAGYDMEVKGTATMQAPTFGFYFMYGNEGNVETSSFAAADFVGAEKTCTAITAEAYKELKTDKDAAVDEGNNENN